MPVHPVRAAWHGSAAAFMCADAGAFASTSRPGSWWRLVVPLLQAALPRVAVLLGWVVALDVRLLRLRRRVDAVVITDRAVLALLIRPEAGGFQSADRLMAEDAALDLADFHSGCRGLPVIPVLLVPDGARAQFQPPLALAGAAPVVEATRLLLPCLLRDVASTFPPLGYQPSEWAGAPYQPVPALIEAACLLYARHDVAALLLAQAGQGGLARTAKAVADALRQAQAGEERVVVFVTGDPGTGKTLCGLNLAFAPGLSHPAAFLTGNPALVHVLREALVRDAVGRGADRRVVRQRVDAVIQGLPAFRDHHLTDSAPPPERLLVIDEAQRCWSGPHAIRKTRNKPVRLTDSEPGHLLDIMARRPGWSVLVCLLGGGQEIHDGEGGLAAWGEALAKRPGWRALAAPGAGEAEDPRQRLPEGPEIGWAPALHLDCPVRAINASQAAPWVHAVLGNDPAQAADIARRAGGVPFRVTRSLQAMRRALQPRGTRNCGLVASSGARRLRAEGLGSVLAHQDEDAVGRWFLDRWPDIRSSDAMEVVATEFSVQGLELDRVGLCWDADLVRSEDGTAWKARRLRANAWTRAGPEAASNRLNAYRVLLTRARHGTVVWVPRGRASDGTRAPGLYDGVARYLLRCGATLLDEAAAAAEDAPNPMGTPEPMLL